MISRAAPTRHPTNVFELKQCGKEERLKIPPERCADLIQSFAPKGGSNSNELPLLYHWLCKCLMGVFKKRHMNSVIISRTLCPSVIVAKMKIRSQLMAK